MRVIHYIRKPQKGYYSFERVFRDVRKALPDTVDVRCVYAWCHSRGLIGRFLNCVQAFFLRADVVHVTGDIHYVVPALIGRKTVLTVHDLAPLRPKRGWQRWIFKKLWYDWPVACADVVTTVSQSVAEELQEVVAGLSIHKIKVIANGIDPAFITCSKDWAERPVVLMVGTKPQKNLERMFEALRGYDVEICVIGKLSQDQVELARKLELSIKMFGLLEQDALVQAYRECDLLAFASTYEGFGLPVVEAQATGRPVLTSDRSVLREVAGDQGAFFVDPQDVASIREGFARILGDSVYRNKLIQSGFENVRRFQVDTIAQSYTKIYQGLLPERASP